MYHALRFYLVYISSYLSTVVYEVHSLSTEEGAHTAPLGRTFSPKISDLPLESVWLPHSPLTPPLMKSLMALLKKLGFACFFVAYQVNDLHPEKCVIRP
jgi:hypothetical protein